MTETKNVSLQERLQARFSGQILAAKTDRNEVTIEVAGDALHDIGLAIRDEPAFAFQILIDLCAVDYQAYGQENGDEASWAGKRFAVVYHLLSINNNERLRVRVWLDDLAPRVVTMTDVWAVANWYEREAFDLFGVMFDGHPDLRRILTDYGFIGHPFRKDFPLWGNVEMRYDAEKGRVVYEPVSIEPRINQPKVIRHDHRYMGRASNDEVSGA
ncbi:MAG: NADH-quinone oxidoreductase subunit C [Gammaproteobacteria bacterium]|nr:NADH-quinone oxidoreductase subunit C [Gammaproteobacteria bacterium]